MKSVAGLVMLAALYMGQADDACAQGDACDLEEALAKSMNVQLLQHNVHHVSATKSEVPVLVPSDHQFNPRLATYMHSVESDVSSSSSSLHQHLQPVFTRMISDMQAVESSHLHDRLKTFEQKVGAALAQAKTQISLSQAAADGLAVGLEDHVSELGLRNSNVHSIYTSPADSAKGYLRAAQQAIVGIGDLSETAARRRLTQVGLALQHFTYACGQLSELAEPVVQSYISQAHDAGNPISSTIAQSMSQSLGNASVYINDACTETKNSMQSAMDSLGMNLTETQPDYGGTPNSLTLVEPKSLAYLSALVDSSVTNNQSFEVDLLSFVNRTLPVTQTQIMQAEQAINDVSARLLRRLRAAPNMSMMASVLKFECGSYMGIDSLRGPTATDATNFVNIVYGQLRGLHASYLNYLRDVEFRYTQLPRTVATHAVDMLDDKLQHFQRHFYDFQHMMSDRALDTPDTKMNEIGRLVLMVDLIDFYQDAWHADALLHFVPESYVSGLEDAGVTTFSSTDYGQRISTAWAEWRTHLTSLHYAVIRTIRRAMVDTGITSNDVKITPGYQ